MLKKLTDILAALKKQGVEISAEASAKVSEEFDGLVIVNADSVAGEGQIVVNEESHKEKMEDLKKYKNSAKKNADELEELKESIDSGDSLNVKLLGKANTELERLRPIAEAFITEKKETWAGVREHIPEQLKKFYTFAKDDEELSESSLIANVAKLNEHMEIKALEIDTKVAPNVSRTTKTGEKVIKVGSEEWRNLSSPSEKIRFAHMDKHPEPQVQTTPKHPIATEEGE